jgi:hypothetical protein
MIDNEINNIPQEIVEVKTEEQKSSVRSPKDDSHVPTNQEIFSNLLQRMKHFYDVIALEDVEIIDSCVLCSKFEKIS